MTLLLTGIHVFACLFLIFVVLLQSAQAADLAGAFGGGGSQTALGMRGATTLLQKATTAAAVIFMLTSLSLGMIDRTSSSVIEGLEGSELAAPAVEAPVPDTATQQTPAGTEREQSSPAAEGAQQQPPQSASGDQNPDQSTAGASGQQQGQR